MTTRKYPAAVDPTRVGTYPERAQAGGGYVWDELLEYRVWCHPRTGGADFFHAFETYESALAFADATPGAERPLALVLQREYIDEPSLGDYRHVLRERVTEWHSDHLHRPRRTTIPSFLSPTAPANRLDILRGLAKPISGS